MTTACTVCLNNLLKQIKTPIVTNYYFLKSMAKKQLLGLVKIYRDSLKVEIRYKTHIGGIVELASFAESFGDKW